MFYEVNEVWCIKLLHASHASAAVGKDSSQSTECKYFMLFDMAYGIWDILKGLADGTQKLSQTFWNQTKTVAQQMALDINSVSTCKVTVYEPAPMSSVWGDVT